MSFRVWILRSWIVRVWALFQRKRLDRALDEDIREHLQMATEENLHRGMNPREAAESARRSFGGTEQMKEEFRDQRGIPVLETVSREMRFAFRSLRRTPGFTVLAILTLALGMGANSAIFSAVNALLFHPAGISEPGGVVVVRARYDKLNIRNLVISLSDFKEVSDSREIFSVAAIARTGEFSYTGGDFPQRLSSLLVTWRWFEVFGAEPAQGRVFLETEGQARNNRVVVLSHAAWQRVFGGDPSIVGKKIGLDDLPHLVIGVMRPEYTAATEAGGLSQSPDVFVPMAPVETRQTRFLEAFLGVARLQSGITLARAESHMRVLTSRGFEVPGTGPRRQENGWGLTIVPYTDFIGGEMKTPMLILWGAVGMVLLIACANIAGLMLARTSARARELAVRAALGGTRWHLLRHLFAESSLVACAGSILGLGVAYAFMRSVEILAPENISGGLKIPFDLPMLLYAAAAGILAAALSGAAPAVDFRRGFMSQAFKDGGRSFTPARNRRRLRSVLVTAEVALALVLSIGAGLLLRSLNRMQQVDIGFRPAGVMSASVALPEARYGSPQKVQQFFREFIQRLQALPGARVAAGVYPVPFGTGYEGRAFQIAGRTVSEGEPAMQGHLRFVTPGFFAALHIPLQRGRLFTEQDAPQTEFVTVIDETLARQYWPNQDALGQKITLQFQGGKLAKIVGIVGHTRGPDLSADSDKGVFYYSFYQEPLAFATFIVQTEDGRTASAGMMREAIKAVDPAQPIYDAQSMDERVAATFAARRFTVALLGLFAITAIFLAALGLYGVINYGVTQRTQEIGIRMALGAQRTQILALIFGEGMRITLLGLALGWIVAAWIAGLVPGQLFGVSAFDPVTFAGMAILLTAVALVASYVPARRAMRLDPLEACRYE